MNSIRLDKDYYGILGVSKDASDDEIKKAYRKLAMEWHPDRNRDNPEAEDKFKEISEANEALLRNPQMRLIYDHFSPYGQFGQRVRAVEDGIPRKGQQGTTNNDHYDFIIELGKAIFEEIFRKKEEENKFEYKFKKKENLEDIINNSCLEDIINSSCKKKEDKIYSSIKKEEKEYTF